MTEIPGLHRKETHLFHEKSGEIIKKLKPVVAKPKRSIRHKKEIIYNGHLSGENFEIFPNIISPQFIVPIINGRLIEGEDETLLNLHFTLFSGAKLFVILWSIILGLASIYCFIVMKNPIYSCVCILLALTNYLIVKGNFDMHSKKSSKQLIDILKSDK